MRLTLLTAVIACTQLLVAAPALAQKSRPSAAPTSVLPPLQPVTDQFGQYCQRYGNDNPPLILVGIDRTTRQIRSAESSGIPAAIDDARATAQPGDRVIVFSIFDHATTKTILFDDCVPGRPYSIFSRRLRQGDVDHDRQQFVALLEQVKLNAMAPIPGRQTSQSAIATTLLGVVEKYRRPIKAVILMTDLLDTETMGLSANQEVTKHTREHLIRAKNTSKAIPDLRNAVVRIYGFGLSDTADSKSVYPFISSTVMDSIKEVWRAFFQAAHVKISDITFIP